MDLFSDSVELVHPLLLGLTSMPESVYGRSTIGDRVVSVCLDSLLLASLGNFELLHDTTDE